MKKIVYLALLLGSLGLLPGCMTSPEYFTELTPQEQQSLRDSAKKLALQAKAMPDHLREVFVEISPHERIIYEGNKRGKAVFRWEIYENVANEKRLTQKDINPYWVRVIATGDLLDPHWELAHATMSGHTSQEKSGSRVRYR